MDERNKQLALRIVSKMYFLTILALVGIVMYRQFILKQDLSDFEDIAIIMTINSLFLIGALFYFGAIPFRKLKIKRILLIYLLVVFLGSLFTYIKYNILYSEGLSLQQLFDKLFIIIVITGLIMAFFILLAILGKRKIDKEIK